MVVSRSAHFKETPVDYLEHEHGLLPAQILATATIAPAAVHSLQRAGRCNYRMLARDRGEPS